MAQNVVCFGDSITRGQFSASYIHLLRERMEKGRFRFFNAGINNDLTYSLLRRINFVSLLRPQFVTVLIGTNDVLASLSPAKSLFYRVTKVLPRWPDLEWSYRNLQQVIRLLKTRTEAMIGLASIPVLGEDLNSPAIQRVKEYNQRVKRLAEHEGVHYLPVFERQEASLNSPGKAYHGSVGLTAEFGICHVFGGESFESFSRRKGFQLLVDGVHLNEKGASMIAYEIERFLNNP